MKRERLSLVTISRINRRRNAGAAGLDIVYFSANERPDFELFRNGKQFEGVIFGICTSGSAEFSVNLKKRRIAQRNLVVIPPGSIIQIHRQSEDFRVGIIAFSVGMFPDHQIHSVLPFVSNMLSDPIAEISVEECDNLMAYFSFIYNKTKRQTGLFRTEITRNLILSLFYEISAVYQKDVPEAPLHLTHAEMVIRKLGRLVIENYKTERNVEFYADKLCLTPKYLSTVVKKTTGKSVPEWLRSIILIDAKVRLKYSALTVQQISNELNFPNPSFFGRFFKKYTGMTPLEYRSSN